MTEDGFLRSVRQLPTPRLRGAARRVALDALSATSRARGRRRAFERPRVQHLYFHHVFGDEEDGFRSLVRDLARDHDFVNYSEGVQRTWSGDFDAPYLAISFDDGLRSSSTAGRILAELGISACFFVVVSMVGETNFRRIAAFCRQSLAMPPVELLDWDDVAQLVEWGHEIGSHTMTHARLADLSPTAVIDELQMSREVLSARIGPVRHFAWPLGRFDAVPPDIVGQALDSGYESCASAVRGAHTSAAPRNELCVRRDHVMARWPARHLRYFLARNSHTSSPETNRFPPRPS